MTEPMTLKLLVATFPDDAGAARALATLTPALGPEAVRQAAVVSKGPDGKVRFLETHDTTTAQGAMQGAGIGAFASLLGILFTPVALLGLPLGAGIGALVAKLRDTGFEDDDLRALGADLESGHSAMVASVAMDDIDKAKRLLAEVDAAHVAVKEIDTELAAALDEEAAAAADGRSRAARRSGLTARWPTR